MSLRLLVILRQYFLVRRVDLFVGFILRKSKFDISECLLIIIKLVPGKSSSIYRLSIVRIDSNRLVKKQLTFLPLVLIVKTHANIEQQISTNL